MWLQRLGRLSGLVALNAVLLTLWALPALFILLLRDFSATSNSVLVLPFALIYSILGVLVFAPYGLLLGVALLPALVWANRLDSKKGAVIAGASAIAGVVTAALVSVAWSDHGWSFATLFAIGFMTSISSAMALVTALRPKKADERWNPEAEPTWDKRSFTVKPAPRRH